MAIRSTIDWNEIVPLLPKPKRDDLYLEAVMILSGSDHTKRRKPRQALVAAAKHTPLLWRDMGMSGKLAQAGRVYRVTPGDRRTLGGAVGTVWKKFTADLKGDTFTYDLFRRFCVDIKVGPKASNLLGYLWSHGYMILVAP
jgi:hypothetical protein